MNLFITSVNVPMVGAPRVFAVVVVVVDWLVLVGGWEETSVGKVTSGGNVGNSSRNEQ